MVLHQKWLCHTRRHFHSGVYCGVRGSVGNGSGYDTLLEMMMSNFLFVTDNGTMFLVRAANRDLAIEAIGREMGEGEWFVTKIFNLSDMKMDTWETGQVKKLTVESPPNHLPDDGK